MRILLVLPAFGKSVTTHLGLAQVSACLRAAGHETALVKLNRPARREKFLRVVRGWQPRIVGFTCVTHHWQQVNEWAAWIKDAAPRIVTCVGGPHPTVDPDQVMRADAIDLVVTGEGEAAMSAVAARLADGRALDELQGIPGVAVRTASGWQRCEPADFINDLDALPFVDRTIFGPEAGGDMPVMAGRGCPFNCTYCCNHILRRVQPGRYVRMRSPAHVIAEIRLERSRRQVRRVVFEDDTFTLRREWLLDFLEQYSREVGLPFVCNARVGNFDARSARALKRAGCDYVAIGVESGCEDLRRNLLGRDMTNARIIETFDLARQEGLATYAFYMIGFPTETPAMAQMTMDLHLRLRPEAGFQISVFYPYPNTRLWEIARDEGVLREQADKVTFEGGVSTLALKHMSRAELLALYERFERMRLESSFSERYLQSNYPWARMPVKVLGRVFGRARILRWARSMRDRLEPDLEFFPSTCEAREFQAEDSE